ncbi:MAG TPA: murein biosynthesis integral membrane protein MurJ [Bryobacteraceae bacterium]|nr:murein biosynthesis integral membrane protein MurJ [Bryobacteraceae bacterium]
MQATAREKHGLLHSAGVISAAVLLSRVTGMVREVVMARLFGAGAANDAFQLAFRIPSLTRNLFAEGALSSALVPAFSRSLAGEGRKEAAELSSLVATAVVLVVGSLSVLGMIFSPQLVRLLAPGFEQIPGKFALTVQLTRIMFPFLLLVALAAQAMAALNASGSFGIPALASSLFNIGSVACGLALGYTVGRRLGNGMIVSMAWGVLAGGALQLLWQLPVMVRAGFRVRPRMDWNHPGLRQIVRMMGPAILGNAALQINIVVNSNFASSIKDASGHVIDGPMSWLGYAFRFLQLPVGLFGVAIASATLPSISRSAGLQKMDEFRTTLSRSLGTILLLTIPSSVGMAVMGESMIAAVYQGGKFTPYDTHQTALALTCFSAGLAGYSALKTLAPAFYALDDARTPMLVSVASIAVNFVTAWVMVKWAGIGHAGLALSTAAVAVFGAVALLVVLRRRLAGIGLRKLAASGAKIAAAAALMGVACKLSSALVHTAMAGRAHVALVDVAISIPLGVAVFYAAARAWRIEELEAVEAACYTALRNNAPRPEVGDPPTRNR